MRTYRRNRLQNLHHLIAHRLAIATWGWLRSQIAHHLKNMTLNNIPNRACLIVKGASTLYAEVLCHRDLDTFNVLTIPERFEKGVREPE